MKPEIILVPKENKQKNWYENNDERKKKRKESKKASQMKIKINLNDAILLAWDLDAKIVIEKEKKNWVWFFFVSNINCKFLFS